MRVWGLGFRVYHDAAVHHLLAEAVPENSHGHAARRGPGHVHTRHPPPEVKSLPRARGRVPVGDILVLRPPRVALDRAVSYSRRAWGGCGLDQLLYRNVQRFRGGLVFKAHRLLYHSAPGLRVIKEKIPRV